MQHSALLKSAAGLSHCWRRLRLGRGLGEQSRVSNWPPSANKAFSLEEPSRPGDFFFNPGVRDQSSTFSSLNVFPAELQEWEVSSTRCDCSPFTLEI